MTNLVPFSLRYAFTKWRLSRVTRPIDRQIAEARRRHKPVRHLMAAKEAVIKTALSGRAG